MAEPSDVISFRILNSSGRNTTLGEGGFSGTGSEKYNLLYSLYNSTDYGATDKLLQALNTVSTSKEPVDTTELKNNLSHYLQLIHQEIARKNAIIERSGLSVRMKKVAAYTINDFNIAGLLTKLHADVKDTNAKKLIKDIFKNNSNYRFWFPLDTEIAALCMNYRFNVGRNEALDVSWSGSTDSVSWSSVYRRLKLKYDGPLRDAMVADFFTGVTNTPEMMNTFNQDIIDSLATEAGELVQLPSARKRIVEQLRRSKGAKVPDALFTNLKGEKVRLSSMKGKVLFLDFWSTGCSACARYHQWFHRNVYPMYKDNKDFVYLSINGDKTKERWLAALKTNRYSSDDYVNLNLNFLGEKHPFFTYYNMTSYPFTMIIGKDGRIYSEAVPNRIELASKILNGALLEKN